MIAQNEGISPTYTFSIKKKIEPPIIDFVPGSVKFVDGDGNNTINANERCGIDFQLKNTGVGDGLQLKAELRATGETSGINFNASQPIENLPKGTTRSYHVDLNGGMNTADGEVEFQLEIVEPNGFNSDIVKLVVASKKFQAPAIQVVDHTVYSSDGSTTLALRKPFALQILVQNTGQGSANNVQCQLAAPENVFFTKGDELVNIGTLEPGETRSLEYEMILNAKFVGTELKLSLGLKESLGKYAQDWTGVFKLNQALAAEKLVVQSKQEGEKNIQVASLRSDVDKDIPLGVAKSSKRYALIIGNEDYSKYQPGLEKEVNVDYAANDARVFAEYAEKTLGVPSENVSLLVDATKGQMTQAIAKLQRLIEVEKGEAEVYFYYSGHGLPEESTNTPYLIPVDVNGTQPSNGLALQDVYASLAKFRTRKAIVILDACFSGGARVKELVAMKSVRVAADVSSVPGNLVVLASSSGTEASAVYRDKQHGYFTYFLLKQLKETKATMPLKPCMEAIEQNVGREAARVGKNQNPTVLFGPEIGLDWEVLKW